VNKDNTVSFEGIVYQIIPSNGERSFGGRWVEVAKLMDGRVEILYGGKRVSYVRLGENGTKRVEEEILGKREIMEEKPKWIAPDDDQGRNWGTLGKTKNVTFLRSN